jgi:crotonobetainyl-CoA:carnitine CoA-transferase CaiB-like acyl-CoA transferase
MQSQAGALSGIGVVELGAGMAVSLVGGFLADCGGSVVRITREGEEDPFRKRYAAYDAWHSNTATCVDPSADEFETILTSADILLVGGEDFPGLPSTASADEIASRYPNLVILDIAGAPRGGEPLPAHDLLAQARSGIVFEQLDGTPVMFPMRPATYGAVLQGLVGVLAALLERDSTGRGQVVRTSLTQGALSWLVARWSRGERADGSELHDIPKGLRWPIFRCSDGVYLQLVLGTPGASRAVYEILGQAADELPAYFKVGQRDPKDYFIDYDRLSPLFARFASTHLLAELTRAGVPTGVCEEPGACWDDPEVAALGALLSLPGGLDRVRLPLVGL